MYRRHQGISRKAAGPRSSEFPWLSAADAARLVADAMSEFHDAGYEVTYAGDGMLAGMDGVRYSLANLARLIAITSEFRRHRVLRRHVRDLLSSSAASRKTLDSIKEIALPRLMATGELAHSGIVAPGYAPSLAPNLHVVITLDYPTHLSTLASPEGIEPYGGWEEVAQHAMENLRGLATPRHHALSADPNSGDAMVYALAADDMHTAARILIIDELLTDLWGVRDSHDGVLFVAPNQDLLAVHPVHGRDVVPATRMLLDIAGAEYGGPARLSPHVYYRAADGVVEQITKTDDNGTVAIDGGLAFGNALARLGLLGG